MTRSATIVALATPPLAAALAIVRISGSDAFAMAQALTGSWPHARGMYLRAITIDKTVVDRCLVLVFEKPASATGEDVVELHLHGNPRIAEAVIRKLIEQGARMAEPGEFTRRAVANGILSLSQAEAVAALVEAATVESAATAARLLGEGLAEPVAALEQQLTELIATVEAQVDFAEEDIDPDGNPELLAATQNLITKLESVLKGWQASAPWRRGLRVVLAGAPNSGKSTLLNRLLGKDRALVSGEAGTTRDYIEAEHRIGSLPVYLVDTAGLRVGGAGEIEAAGMLLAREQIARADLVLWLRRPEDRGVSASGSVDPTIVSPATPSVEVWNFADDPGYGDWRPDDNGVLVSAKTGEGLASLETMILERFQWHGTPVMQLVSERQAAAVDEALGALHRARALIFGGGLPELVAEEFYGARQALALLLGDYDRERTLDAVFSHFCIGK